MPEPTPSPRRRRRGARIAAVAAVLLAALVAAAYLLLPWIARPLLERALSTALGAPVAIGALNWQPTAGRVEAQRVAIGTGEQVGAARVLVEGDVRALWRGQLVLDRLEVDAPSGNVELDARYRPVLPGGDAGGAAPAPLPPITLRQVLVTDGEITVRYPVQRELRAAQLHITQLTASDFSAAGGDADLTGQLTGTLDGAPLEVSGRLHLAGEAVDIEASGGVSGLVVNRRTINLLPALDTFHATVDLRATYTATSTPAVQRLGLDVTLHEPRITDEAGTEFAAETVVLPGVAVDLLSGAIAVDHIAVDQPVGALQLDAQFRPTLTRFGSGSSTAAAGSPPPVTVRELVVTDGTLTLRYPVAGQLRAAPLQIARLVCSNIALTEGRVALDATLNGTLDGAPLQVEAHLRPGDAGRAVAADVRLSDLTVDRAHLDLPAGFETLRARVDVQATIAAPDPSTSPTARLDLRLREPRFSPAGAELAATSVNLPAIELDLAQQRVSLGAVTLDGPTIDLTLPVAAGGASGGASAWTVRADAIDVRNARLRLHRGDAALALAIPTLRWGGWTPAQPQALSLRASGDGGAALSVTGALGLTPLDAALEVQAGALPLPILSRLLDVLPVQLARGSGDATLRITHQGGRLRIHGTARAQDVHTLPPDPARPAEVMAVNRADATLTYDSGATPPLDVASLTLSYPYAMVQRRAAGTFPTTLLRNDARADAAGRDTPHDGAAQARLRQVQIEGGKLEFIDTTLDPDFWTSFSHMTAEATELRLPPAPGARFTVAAKRDEISSVEISGAYSATGLEGRATLQDAMLASFNPYVAPLLGYDVTAGWLSLVLRATPAPPRYDATAQLVLRGVEVTQTGVDAIQSQSGVPLPIALSLIADSSGQIDMTLPLAFDTASGRVTVGSIVGQAVRSAIVGALTSPLRILGSLFGTKGAPHAFAIDPIPFPAGVATLDAAGAARVAEIARILQAHPGLALVAAPQISATELATLGARDAQALADERLATVRAAFTGADAAYRLPAARLMPVPWTPPTDQPPSGPPGVYVELQDQP